jgi:hypothetical protein
MGLSLYISLTERRQEGQGCSRVNVGYCTGRRRYKDLKDHLFHLCREE